MSLGNCTKCDLSAGIAKLDITTLTTQIERRFFSLAEQIRGKMNAIQVNCLTKEDRAKSVSYMVSVGSEELITIANDMAEVAELLHTLNESKDRKIEIVNKNG